ncbi:hypothetical protein BGZ83_001724, partial [Gryganskiella cystojenkinii]
MPAVDWAPVIPFWKHESLKQHLRELCGDGEDLQQEVVLRWLWTKEPGYIIRDFVCKVQSGDLTAKQCREAGVRTATIENNPEGFRNHVNNLRNPSFNANNYDQKECCLSGSIATDGKMLRVPAFNLRELKSVQYKGLMSERMPNCLLLTRLLDATPHAATFAAQDAAKLR